MQKLRLLILLMIVLIPVASALIGNDSSTTVRYETGYITFNSTSGDTKIQSFGDYISSLIRLDNLRGWVSGLDYNFFRPVTPDLHLPENNTYRNTTTNMFEWSNTTDPEDLKVDYLFEIWNDSSTTNINLANHSILETANTTKTEETIIGEGIFYWRVAANDSKFNSSFSELRAIVIDQTLPAQFDLSSPADAASTQDTTPVLEWNASSDTNLDNYTIEISTEADFSIINQTEVSTTSSLSNWSAALSADTYYWRVIAVDKANNHQPSNNNFSLTIQGSETVTVVTGTSGTTTSGGGTKPFTLNILAPEGITIARNDVIEVPLLIINPSGILLRGINLDIQSDEPKITVTLSSTYISEISAQSQEKLTLKIDARDVEVGSYGITINAAVTSPQFTDTARLFANLLEKSAGEQQVQDQIDFAKRLFNGNPECLDLSEYIEQAELALQKQSLDVALSMAENAVAACNKLLEQKDQFTGITTSATFIDRIKTQVQSKTFMIVSSEVLSMLILVFIFYRYMKSKRKKKKEI